MEITKIDEKEVDLNPWDEATSGGEYVILEEEKRVKLVAKNARFNDIEKDFEGKGKKIYKELVLDVVEEDDKPCEKKLTTLSKRLIKKLRPLFENVKEENEVRFTIKRIGTRTDTNWDVERL